MGCSGATLVPSTPSPSVTVALPSALESTFGLSVAVSAGTSDTVADVRAAVEARVSTGLRTEQLIGTRGGTTVVAAFVNASAIQNAAELIALDAGLDRPNMSRHGAKAIAKMPCGAATSMALSTFLHHELPWIHHRGWQDEAPQEEVGSQRLPAALLAFSLLVIGFVYLVRAHQATMRSPHARTLPVRAGIMLHLLLLSTRATAAGCASARAHGPVVADCACCSDRPAQPASVASSATPPPPPPPPGCSATTPESPECAECPTTTLEPTRSGSSRQSAGMGSSPSLPYPRPKVSRSLNMVKVEVTPARSPKRSPQKPLASVLSMHPFWSPLPFAAAMAHGAVLGQGYSPLNMLRATTMALTVAASAGGCAITPDANGHVVIPADTAEVGASAYYGCTDLSAVTIGDSVTSIGTVSSMPRPPALDLRLRTFSSPHRAHVCR